MDVAMSKNLPRLSQEKFSFLKNLPQSAIEWLDDFAVLQTWKKGQYLIHEGDTAEGLHIVQTGITKITKISIEGKEAILHLVYPGGVVGESPIFHNGKSPIDVVAVTHASTFFIPAQALMQLLKKDHTFALTLLRILSIRERMLYNKLGTTQQNITAQRRLAGWLLHRQTRTDSEKVETGVSQETLARLLGVARETLNRELVALSKANVIEVTSTHINILDRTALELIYEA